MRFRPNQDNALIGVVSLLVLVLLSVLLINKLDSRTDLDIDLPEPELDIDIND